MQRNNENKLPRDLALMVFNHLSPLDAAHTALTCKHFMRIFNVDNYWRQRLQKDFHASNLPKGFSSYKEYYKSLHLEAKRFIRQVVVNCYYYRSTDDLREYTRLIIKAETGKFSLNSESNPDINKAYTFAKQWLQNILSMPDNHLSFSRMQQIHKVYKRELRQRGGMVDEHMFNTDFDFSTAQQRISKDMLIWQGNADFFLSNLAYLPALGCKHLLGLVLDKHPDLLHMTTDGRHGHSFIIQAISHFQVDTVHDLLERMHQSGFSFDSADCKDIRSKSGHPTYTPLMCAIFNSILMIITDAITDVDRYESEAQKIHLQWVIKNREKFLKDIESIIQLLMNAGFSLNENSCCPIRHNSSPPLEFIDESLANIYIKNSPECIQQIIELKTRILEYSKLPDQVVTKLQGINGP